jgi:glycosyltransferase involved in cell wall biosynthesis
MEPFNGDFIQRHARAAALYNDIHLVHVAGDASGKTLRTSEVLTKMPGLTEQIIYYKRSSSVWGKLVAHYRWQILFRQAVKKYISENGKPGIVHVHIPMKAGLVGMWMKKKYGVQYVLTEHWGIYNDVEVQNYAGKSNTFKRFTKKIFKGAATFISVSRYLAKGVNRLVMKKDYVVIPNATDTSLFFYEDKPLSIFRFIHVSNMVPLKNAEGILRAFKLFLRQQSNVQLIMLGDTDPAIRQYAEGLGLGANSVSFAGEVPYEQVAKAMQQANCFILFSNIENSPCVIGEALCCGLPVITTTVGGIPELVNERNSFLIPPKDEDALTDAMQQMLEKHTSFNCKEIAEDAQCKFSYLVIGKKIDEVYTAIAAGKN